jgi:transcriptional regulator with PAS, ATPase and Fis domain
MPTLGPIQARELASNDSVRAALTVRDPTIDAADELLVRIARSDINVLIQGETGTGKEVLARTLHHLSRRPGELVAINCAALTGDLLESELFGHERGAFTGATRTKPGLLEVAGRGTALLDEIGDLPLELQGKLLRALESRKVYRVGGVQPVELHLRVIAATHKLLPEAVERGTFRQDLYFRLDGLTLELPPLRARQDAILPLAQRFLADAARAAEQIVPPLGPGALAALEAHDWPGNVRELRLVMERALLLAGGAPIEAKHLLVSAARTGMSGQRSHDRDRARFLAVARAHGGNVSAMSREFRTSRSQIRRLERKYRIELEALRRRS